MLLKGGFTYTWQEKLIQLNKLFHLPVSKTISQSAPIYLQVFNLKGNSMFDMKYSVGVQQIFDEWLAQVQFPMAIGSELLETSS